ncbi:hypothetical protein SAMN05661044_00703 [Olivibacter domesticus]|uniref:Uncharacterized protein n=2 Tax=Olivibacter domesticus TaxID=407022 RepID=A0A1H7IJ04_OLID1|nr:hypothetical protein SAMN05661044_00703 [Olivibacter domesticus]
MDRCEPIEYVELQSTIIWLLVRAYDLNSRISTQMVSIHWFDEQSPIIALNYIKEDSIRKQRLQLTWFNGIMRVRNYPFRSIWLTGNDQFFAI